MSSRILSWPSALDPTNPHHPKTSSQSCGTEPLPCGIWHYVQVDSIRTELYCRTLNWCQNLAWCGKTVHSLQNWCQNFWERGREIRNRSPGSRPSNVPTSPFPQITLQGWCGGKRQDMKREKSLVLFPGANGTNPGTYGNRSPHLWTQYKTARYSKFQSM